MRIKLTVNGNEMSGTLGEGTAARDFATLLPLALTVTDFNGRERAADLPRPLNFDGIGALLVCSTRVTGTADRRVIGDQLVRLGANFACTERRSTDGQMILMVTPLAGNLALTC